MGDIVRRWTQWVRPAQKTRPYGAATAVGSQAILGGNSWNQRPGVFWTIIPHLQGGSLEIKMPQALEGASICCPGTPVMGPGLSYPVSNHPGSYWGASCLPVRGFSGQFLIRHRCLIFFCLLTIQASVPASQKVFHPAIGLHLERSPFSPTFPCYSWDTCSFNWDEIYCKGPCRLSLTPDVQGCFPSLT